jgi:catechol-2,3-dioxygenase
LESARPAALADFYSRALGYRIQQLAEDEFIASAINRALLIARGRDRRASFIAYAVDRSSELRRLDERAQRAGVGVEAFHTPLFETGAVSVLDPDGNRVVFGVPIRERAKSKDEHELSARLQHAVISSRSADRLMHFYANALGFTVSDLVTDGEGKVRTCFLRSSAEHHSFAVFQAAKNRLDHHCYETRDWNEIRDWADHFAQQRIPIVWGPGRHGPGNNLFIFIHDADGNWVELSSELELVSHDRPVGTWPHEQRTLNSWGQGLLRS